MQKKLTVRVITYNQEAYIKQALDSILMQKANFPFEIIVSDDASTDTTQEILKLYQQKYPEIIKVILHEKNLGGRKNLLSTLSLCTGKYVAFLDGDDYWIDEYKLQKQVDFLEASPEFNICFHNANVTEFFNENKSRLANNLDKQIFNIEDVIVNGWFIITSSMVIRNPNPLPDWITNSVNRNIDYSLHLWLTLNGKAYFLPDIMSVYRIHERSISMLFNSKEWCNSHNHIFDNFDRITDNKYKVLTNDKRASVIYLRIVKKQSIFHLLFWKNLYYFCKNKKNLNYNDITSILKFLVKKYLYFR